MLTPFVPSLSGLRLAAGALHVGRDEALEELRVGIEDEGEVMYLRRGKAELCFCSGFPVCQLALPESRQNFNIISPE